MSLHMSFSAAPPSVLAANDSVWSFPIFPQGASAEASHVDPIYFCLLVVSGLLTFLVFFFLIYFAIKYRAGSRADRSNPIGTTVNKYEIAIEVIWAVVPTVVMLLFFGWAAYTYFHAEVPPRDARTIYVVARQWMWKIKHPQGQREINTLHVPVGVPIKLVMTSQDVIHSFYVPAFRKKQDVLPDRYSTLWFKANRVGRYHLFCAEYCGEGHSHMTGTVVVMKPEDYADWLGPQTPGPGPTAGTPAAAGTSIALNRRGIFYKLDCNVCHLPSSAKHAPRLDGLFDHEVRLSNNSKVIADEQYLRESILNPQAKIVAGYQTPSRMPTYKGRITEQQIQKLIEFIKSIRTGWPKGVPQKDEKPPRNHE